jgi:hypothetical protein
MPFYGCGVVRGVHRIARLSHQIKPIDALQDRSLVNRKRGASAVTLLPAILNSEEEIEWKVQPPNRNLWQGVV